MLGVFVSAVGSLATQWLTNRQEISKAAAERKAERIRQDGDIAENLTKGFKDELWTITLLSPVWVGMIGALTGSHELTERAKDITEVMVQYAPMEVWSGLLLISAVVSFGGRVTDVMDRIKGFRK